MGTPITGKQLQNHGEGLDIYCAATSPTRDILLQTTLLCLASYEDTNNPDRALCSTPFTSFTPSISSLSVG